MNVFVTGGAGFAGSHLVDAFLALGAKVVVYDRLSTGREDFLTNAQTHPNFVQLIRGDVLDVPLLTQSSYSSDLLVHLAANADLKDNASGSRRVFEQNTLATFNVLEVCKVNRIKRLIFPSSCAVYGPGAIIPTPEAWAPRATSLYAASKIAGEAMIQAYCETFRLQAGLFRFVSLMGERYTHGLVCDFVRKMRKFQTKRQELPGNDYSLLSVPDKTPTVEVLGDGSARKDYLYVDDMAAAVMTYLDQVAYAPGRCDLYNLGTETTASVKECVAWIASELGVSPEYTYTGGAGGWVGDNPLILPDTSKIRALGWAPTLNIEQAIRITTAYVDQERKTVHA